MPPPTCCHACKQQAIAKNTEGGFQDPIESLHFTSIRVERERPLQT